MPIDYGDIYNTRALVELAGQGIIPAPEPSLGTHFFQDLMEAQIYPLAISLDDPLSVFNRHFFYEMPDHTAEWINIDPSLAACLRLIKVSDYQPDSFIKVVMNDEKGQALAFIEQSNPHPAAQIVGALPDELGTRD